MKRSDALEVLFSGFTHSVKDPLWGNIPIDDGLKGLLDTEEVRKLARIKQNGPAYHIYPGAVHTRLNHSLGVYYLAREILISISNKAEELPFTPCGIKSFLAACLLHDIGHFPYAHSLKELALKEHEAIAAELILNEGKLRKTLEDAGASPEMAAAIIDKDLPASEETGIYRSMLSGTLDPDKLDYLTRDGFFAGIPYGTQDTSYIISSMSIADGHLVIDESAISSVEQVLFSKYMMYRSLYWHKGVRSATAMIKKALISGIRDGIIGYGDLYLKDDWEFYQMCQRKAGYPPFSLIEMAEHGKLFERKAYRPFLKDGALERKTLDIQSRHICEGRIFQSLRDAYPELKEHEVIIDIPEPINFETHIGIRMADGTIQDISSTNMIFSKAGETFSSSLRIVALYLPAYVKTADAERAFRSEDE